MSRIIVDNFPTTGKTHDKFGQTRKGDFDIHNVHSCHVETCALLVRESAQDDEVVSIKVDLNGIELDQGRYVPPEKRKNYNPGSGEGKVPICPPEKEEAIMDAFRHYNLI